MWTSPRSIPASSRWERAVERRLFVGGNRFVLRPCPRDDHRLGKFPGPGKHERGIALFRWRVRGSHLRGAWRIACILSGSTISACGAVWHLGCPCAVLASLHRGEEGLYAGVGGVGVQFLGGVPAHQMLGFQPDAFAPHRSPKGDEGLGVELPTLMGQFVQLFAGADLHAAYPLPTHVHLFFIPALKPVISPVKMQGLKPLYASPLPFCMARLAAG